MGQPLAFKFQSAYCGLCRPRRRGLAGHDPQLALGATHSHCARIPSFAGRCPALPGPGAVLPLAEPACACQLPSRGAGAFNNSLTGSPLEPFPVTSMVSAARQAKWGLAQSPSPDAEAHLLPPRPTPPANADPWSTRSRCPTTVVREGCPVEETRGLSCRRYVGAIVSASTSRSWVCAGVTRRPLAKGGSIPS